MMLFQNEKVNKIQKNRLRKDREITSKKNHLVKIKKERKCSLKCLFFKFPPLNKKLHSEKVSLCSSFFKRICKASLGIETALVLPVFFFGVVAMISFMDIYRVQTEHFTKLCESAKEAGMYAYLTNGQGPDEITLPDFYSYKPISGFLNLPKVNIYNTVKVHSWTGREFGSGRENNGEEREREKMVYMTETGEVYHVDENCSYLNLSIKNVSGTSVSSLRNDYGEKYKACETCSRHQSPSSGVYITKTGNKYHNSITCSGLKRSVRLVRESDAKKGHHSCSRCGDG